MISPVDPNIGVFLKNLHNLLFKVFFKNWTKISNTCSYESPPKNFQIHQQLSTRTSDNVFYLPFNNFIVYRIFNCITDEELGAQILNNLLKGYRISKLWTWTENAGWPQWKCSSQLMLPLETNPVKMFNHLHKYYNYHMTEGFQSR